MVKVRILVGLSGTPYTPGEEIALPDDRAKQFVRDGVAELIESPRSSEAPTFEAADRQPKVRKANRSN